MGNLQKTQCYTRILGITLFLLLTSRVQAGERIVTLIPTWGETLEKLLEGSGHQLVGVSEATTLKDRSVPSIADHVKIYRESLLKLNPTLWIKDRSSIAHSGLTETVEKNARVLELECTNWAVFVDSFRRIASQLGLEKKAEQLLIVPFQVIEEILKNRDQWLVHNRIPPRRLFRVGFVLDSTERRIAGRKTIFEDVFQDLGVINAFGELEGYPRVQKEWMTLQKADRLLESYSDSVDKRYEGIFKMGLAWPEAIKNFQRKFYSEFFHSKEL